MITVAIDGPAGVGKSSISKALAKRFGLAYLDTGAMYRAATWWCLQQGADLNDADAVAQAVLDFAEHHLRMSCNPRNPRIYSDETDISAAIRGTDVSSHVSRVSSIPAVRSILINAQKREIAAQSQPDSFSEGRGVVAEGRDITTVVAPKAEVRVLLTARDSVRQKRRAKQARRLHTGVENVAARDRADSKVTHFLTAAKGVTTIDNSDMNFEQTLEAFSRIVEAALRKQQEEADLRGNSAKRSARTTEGEDSAYLAAADGTSAINDASAADSALNTDDKTAASENADGAFSPQLEELDALEDEYALAEEDFDLLRQRDSDAAAPTRAKQEGVLAVVGRPNVGKSTLVNRILRRKAAVVEDHPGVTRDRVSYQAEWAGTDFLLVDTGGWEADVEGIDAAVADQAEVAVRLADAVLLVVDAKTGMTASDERIVKMLRRAGKPVILAVNKIDKSSEDYEAADFWRLGLGEPHPISAMHGLGIGDLLDVCMGTLKKADKVSGLMRSSNLRRVALVGRPNVGKSSLLNQLAHENRSVVNDIAGTTRDPVDEVIDLGGKDWLFIDTAGIKRRLHRIKGAEYYSTLRSQAAIERSELALVLFDVSQPIAEQDLRVMSQAVDAGRAIVLVFNKWDLLDDYGRERIERLYKSEFDRVTWAERVNLSAKTGWHTNRLTAAMETALNSWDKRIPTSKLNTFLGKVQAAHPHPLRGGKQPRILFATQASAQPPRFVIFATGFLDHSYRRFLERQLREEFGFTGTPIQISVRIREKKRQS